MSTDPRQGNPSRLNRVLAGLGVGALVVVMVILHLSGVIGAGSH